MSVWRRVGRDPWWDDGVGARRARTRRRTMTMVALGLAVVACGLTAAAWVHTLVPTFQPFGLG